MKMMIDLLDARRGLHEKCVELFGDKKIADLIYSYLCDGIEDCDVIEVVRCKDCKDWDCHDEYCINFLVVDPNGYCSYGERREDEVN